MYLRWIGQGNEIWQWYDTSRIRIVFIASKTKMSLSKNEVAPVETPRTILSNYFLAWLRVLERMFMGFVCTAVVFIFKVFWFLQHEKKKHQKYPKSSPVYDFRLSMPKKRTISTYKYETFMASFQKKDFTYSVHISATRLHTIYCLHMYMCLCMHSIFLVLYLEFYFYFLLQFLLFPRPSSIQTIQSMLCFYVHE